MLILEVTKYLNYCPGIIEKSLVLSAWQENLATAEDNELIITKRETEKENILKIYILLFLVS